MEQTLVRCDVCNEVMPQGHGTPIVTVTVKDKLLELRVTFNEPSAGQDICDDCAIAAAKLLIPAVKDRPKLSG